MYAIIEIFKDEQDNFTFGEYTHCSSVDMSNADVLEDREQVLSFIASNNQVILDSFNTWLENPEYPCTLYAHFRYIENYTTDGVTVVKQSPSIIFVTVTDVKDLQY